MNNDFFFEKNIVFKYFSKHWNLEFEKIEGYDILSDIITVFGYSDNKAKLFIKEWFSEFNIPDDWWEPKWPTKFTWTREMVQDVAAFHTIDAEAELIRLLSDEISHYSGIPKRYFGAIDPALPNPEIQIRSEHIGNTLCMDVYVQPKIKCENIEMNFTVTPTGMIC